MEKSCFLCENDLKCTKCSNKTKNKTFENDLNEEKQNLIKNRDDSNKISDNSNFNLKKEAEIVNEEERKKKAEQSKISQQESKAEFDDYSHDYKKVIGDSIKFSGLTVDFFAEGKANFFNQLVNQKSEHVILDIGCGIGAMHPYLAQKGRTIVGVDVSSESIKIAKDTYKNNIYTTYDGNTLPFEDDTFDGVLTVCVMHHVPPKQWQDFINEMVRVTKPGGTVAIFEHNPFNPVTRYIVNRCPFDKDAVLLRSKLVETMLSKTSQLKPSTSFIFFIPLKYSIFRKIEKFLKCLPLGAQYCTYGKKI
jgi:ubiquinone/menaquinone biosynthesis C-methylase UbiE